MMALLQKKTSSNQGNQHLRDVCVSWTCEKPGRLPGIYEAAIQKGDR